MSVKADPGGFPQRRVSDVPAVSAGQMKEIQRVAQEDFGIDILQMMENAGRSAAVLALAMLGGRAPGKRVVVLAGGGNKGGAGLCAVRNLANWGMMITTIFGAVESEMSFVAQRQVTILRNAGIVEPPDTETSEYTLEEQLEKADLVIDALVGYGLESAPTGMPAAIADLAMQARRPVLALDVPTGVNATSGEPNVPAIKAVTTLMLDLPKRGMLDPRSRAHVGELYLADLGIPRIVHEQLGVPVGQLFSEGPIVKLRR